MHDEIADASETVPIPPTRIVLFAGIGMRSVSLRPTSTGWDLLCPWTVRSPPSDPRAGELGNLGFLAFELVTSC